MKKLNKEERDPIQEYQAGSTLVDDGIKFSIPLFFGMKLRLTVRPLRPGTIIKISQQVALLRTVNESESMIPEMLKSGNNVRNICRIIALGCTNTRLKTRYIAPVLTNILIWKIKNMPDLFAYISIIYRQMGAQHFFFIMALTNGMNFLEKRTAQEKPGAAKQSGERSH